VKQCEETPGFVLGQDPGSQTFSVVNLRRKYGSVPSQLKKSAGNKYKYG